MAILKLSEASIKALPLSAKGQILYYDTNLKGFGVRVGQESKTFIAEYRLKGKTRRVTIGPCSLISAEQARKRAKVILSEMAQGIDRRASDEIEKLKAVTLNDAYTEFKNTKKDQLADRTIQDYEKQFKRLMPDWMKEPWVSITPTMVFKRHSEIKLKNGGPTANHVMRALGSVIRFSMKRYRDEERCMLIAECPTTILSDTSAWCPEKARDRYIKANELKAWWTAVASLENTNARDFLIFLILTGFRLSEARTLKWIQVDLQARTITLEITKNKKKHVLPIPEFLYQMLLLRKETASNDFVFPGDGENGHIVEVRKNIAKVVKASGVAFTPHDLRRTFSNCLELADVSYYAHKKLMNHAVGGDVTFKHYLSIHVERLREPMEKLARYILTHAGALPTAEVIQLPMAQKQAVG